MYTSRFYIKTLCGITKYDKSNMNLPYFLSSRGLAQYALDF